MEKVVIAIPDKGLLDRYNLTINKDSNFLVVQLFQDGVALVDYISKNRIDFLIIDLSITKLDGISAINSIRKNYDYNVGKIIVLSDFTNGNIVNLLSQFRVDYFLLKPVLPEGLVAIMEILSNSNVVTKHIAKEATPDLETKVNRLITNLGFPSHISGSHYLVTAICSAVRSSYMSGQLTKSLYPEVARKHNTTASRVERSIRHAIEITYNRNPKALSNYLQGYNYKPTNAELIATITDKLRIEE